MKALKTVSLRETRYMPNIESLKSAWVKKIKYSILLNVCLLEIDKLKMKFRN